jgi:hypothetical protein
MWLWTFFTKVSLYATRDKTADETVIVQKDKLVAVPIRLCLFAVVMSTFADPVAARSKARVRTPLKLWTSVFFFVCCVVLCR